MRRPESSDVRHQSDYRMLASFDVNEIDEELIEASRAAIVHAEASQTANIELPVWVAPY